MTASYRVSIEEKPQYVHLTGTGTHCVENARRFLLDAHEACVRRNASAVLLEMNFTGASLSAGRIFDIITEGSGRALRLRRIAYVDGSAERDPNNKQFAATVAANRGVNVRLFSTVREADRWLSADDEEAGKVSR